MTKILLLAAAISITGLAASCGSADTSKSAAEKTDAPAAVATPPGALVYTKTWVACHQANGEGLPNSFPPLAKSDFLKDKDKVISQVIKGYTGELTVNGKQFNGSMPAQPLNDQEIADVLTYVYSNFGNTGAPVTVDEVKAVRGRL